MAKFYTLSKEHIKNGTRPKTPLEKYKEKLALESGSKTLNFPLPIKLKPAKQFHVLTIGVLLCVLALVYCCNT